MNCWWQYLITNRISALPADLVEEILRIDGLDNIPIPEAITLTPSVEENYGTEAWREKISGYMVGLGFNEILTNSITNSSYFTQAELATAVSMLNNLSAELNIMRPSMLETGLEVIAHNLNRRNNDLRNCLNLERPIHLKVWANTMNQSISAFTLLVNTWKIAGAEKRNPQTCMY